MTADAIGAEGRPGRRGPAPHRRARRRRSRCCSTPRRRPRGRRDRPAPTAPWRPRCASAGRPRSHTPPTHGAGAEVKWSRALGRLGPAGLAVAVGADAAAAHRAVGQRAGTLAQTPGLGGGRSPAGRGPRCRGSGGHQRVAAGLAEQRRRVDRTAAGRARRLRRSRRDGELPVARDQARQVSRPTTVAIRYSQQAPGTQRVGQVDVAGPHGRVVGEAAEFEVARPRAGRAASTRSSSARTASRSPWPAIAIARRYRITRYSASSSGLQPCLAEGLEGLRHAVGGDGEAHQVACPQPLGFGVAARGVRHEFEGCERPGKVVARGTHPGQAERGRRDVGGVGGRRRCGRGSRRCPARRRARRRARVPASAPARRAPGRRRR